MADTLNVPTQPVIDQNFGQSPANFTQNTWSINWDTLYWAPASVLDSSYSLFDASQSKPKQYRSTTFTQIAQQKNIGIKALRVSTNISFAQRSSEPLIAQQQYFEEFSYLEFKVTDKTYDRIKLSDLLNYKIQNLGGTSTPVVQDYPYYILPETILIPTTGSIELTFYPAAGITLAAAGVTNPELPNLGLTNNYGFSLSFSLLGAQVRPVA